MKNNKQSIVSNGKEGVGSSTLELEQCRLLLLVNKDKQSSFDNTCKWYDPQVDIMDATPSLRVVTSILLPIAPAAKGLLKRSHCS
ncbi:hypothetical protein QQP08_003699 [Theobroma cacao]|nr:hypothetical protein QQP08_003699 [Theobroma cacao]